MLQKLQNSDKYADFRIDIRIFRQISGYPDRYPKFCICKVGDSIFTRATSLCPKIRIFSPLNIRIAPKSGFLKINYPPHPYSSPPHAEI